MFHWLWQSQPSHEVAQAVGQYKQPQPHLVSNEPVTREPRPVQGVFAFLDPLLGRAPPVVLVGYAYRWQAQVGDDEPDPRE